MRVTAGESWGTWPSESTAESTETVSGDRVADVGPAGALGGHRDVVEHLAGRDQPGLELAPAPHCGCWADRIAAAPAMCGVAIEVPLIDV